MLGHRGLRDFTTDPRVLVIAGIAVVVATAGVAAGVVLLKLSRLVTNIAFLGSLASLTSNWRTLRLVFGRFSSPSPARSSSA